MEALIQSYAKKNVFFFHTLGGDQDVPNIHFKKHYRLTYPVISDNLDRYRHIIRVSGITNVAVFGGDGICVFNKSFMGDDFRSVIDKTLAAIKGPNRKKAAFIDGGTVYAPDVKKEGRILHERMPCLAAGPAGELHLAYVSDEKGSNDVMLRSFAKGKWSKPSRIAATKADEYAPSVAALGKGLAMVAYVSNEKGRYDIYTVLVKNGKRRKIQRLTRSRDDAMAPSVCRGDKGDAWLVWYEWSKMGPLSRDREILISRSQGGGWSRPVQVSPHAVPTYEDHADPVVFPDKKGGVWVAWTWDYHGTLREKPPVEENSIFLRHVDGKMQTGAILAAGFRGSGRARDYVPTLAVTPDGVPWTAWDNSHKSSLGYGAKAIFLNHLGSDDFGEQVEVAASRGQLDSPRLILDPKGELHLLWCQETPAGWELWHRHVSSALSSKPRKLPLKGASPRYPSGCFDSKGRLWVAYVDTGSKTWKVRMERFD